MDASFYKTYFEIEKNHWLFRARRNIFLSLIKKYKVSSNAKIFDFGCGSGYTVGYLQDKGYQVSGSDTSIEAIEFGQSKGIKNLVVARNNDFFDQSQEFDLILAFDVIEHIEDDVKVVRNIEKALKPGGLAIITVPAYMWMWGVQDQVSQHYRRYTLKSLKKVIEADGNFVFLKKSYFNTFLFPGVVLVRMISKVFNFKERQSDFDLNNKFFNAIFYFIFNLEAKLLKYVSFPFGVSVVVVLKKNLQSI